MKRNFLTVIFIIVILLPGNLKAQQYELKWETLNIGTEAAIYGITSIGEDTIIACGTQGTIIKSIDAGKTWLDKISDSSISNDVFSEIKFANSNIGFMVGLKTLFKTFDGGETWKTIHNFNDNIKNLTFSNMDTLYLILGRNNNYIKDKLLRSIDGGNNWSCSFEYPGTVGNNGLWINNIFFINNIGYLITSQVISKYQTEGRYKYNIYKSFDYGNKWDSISEFENIWDDIPNNGQMIKYVQRPTALFFNSKDSGNFYLSKKTIKTENGFKSFQIYNTNNEGFMGASDYVDAFFQPNGNHCMVYYHESEDLPNLISQMKYSNDNGKTWPIGKNNVCPPEKLIYYTSSYRTKNSTFYIGFDKGILRSPAITSSIDHNEAENIKIFPNPAKTNLTIETNNLNISKIAVFDLMGKHILSIDIAHTESFKLDCSNLSTGIYLLKITTDQGIIIKKISKL